MAACCRVLQESLWYLWTVDQAKLIYERKKIWSFDNIVWLQLELESDLEKSNLQKNQLIIDPCLCFWSE